MLNLTVPKRYHYEPVKYKQQSLGISDNVI